MITKDDLTVFGLWDFFKFIFEKMTLTCGFIFFMKFAKIFHKEVN